MSSHGPGTPPGPWPAAPTGPRSRPPHGRRPPTGAGARGTPRTASGATPWPPPGAEPLDTEGLYDQLDAAGFGYGPLFRGLRAAWRLGQEVFAEVTLPAAAAAEAASFGIHPALLDAALHASAFAGIAEHGLPFCWQDVTLHAGGASSVRVRLSPAGDDAVSIELADPARSEEHT